MRTLATAIKRLNLALTTFGSSCGAVQMLTQPMVLELRTLPHFELLPFGLVATPPASPQSL